MLKTIKYIFFIFIATLNACNNPNNTIKKPTVSVSVIPQKFFVNQIAGNFLDVNVMVPAGASPATYEPTPMQMKNLSHSSAYFRIGHIAFEKAWMNKLSSINPKMKIIDTSEGLPLIFDEDFNDVHTDAHGHSHSHEGYNPHTWLAPKLVKLQAEIIFHNLSQLYPEQKEQMKVNYAEFISRCDSLQVALDNKFKPLSGTHFIVYHPVWTYLADEYKLKQIAIEHSGKEATADKLKHIIDFAKENDVTTIFVQKEFNDSQAQTIAKEINGHVVPLNPLDYNWFNTLHEFTEAFN